MSAMLGKSSRDALSACIIIIIIIIITEWRSCVGVAECAKRVEEQTGGNVGAFTLVKDMTNTPG